MTPRVVIDTNVVVAGLLTGRGDSPVARVLDGMLAARFPFVVSAALLSEYFDVLLRPALRKLHGLATGDIESIVTTLAEHAMVLTSRSGPPAPDPGDQHLWDLLAADAALWLVTGDKRLLVPVQDRERVMTPQAFVAGWSDRHMPPPRNR